MGRCSGVADHCGDSCSARPTKWSNSSSVLSRSAGRLIGRYKQKVNDAELGALQEERRDLMDQLDQIVPVPTPVSLRTHSSLLSEPGSTALGGVRPEHDSREIRFRRDSPMH